MNTLKQRLRNEGTTVASRLMFLNDMKIWQKFVLVWLGFAVSTICFLSLIVSKHSESDAARWTEFSNIDYLLFITGIVSIVVSFLVALAQVRSISRGLNRVIYYFDEIGQGNLENYIEVPGSDEIGQMLHALTEMQLKLKTEIEEATSRAETALQIKTALNNAAANVMVVDIDHKVIFVNQSLQKLMDNSAKSISHVVNDFDPKSIIGMDINWFFPVNQKDWINLDNLNGTATCHIQIDDRNFKITAAAVFTESGKRLGSALEWKDITAAVKVEQEVDSTVNAVVSGDFMRRIDVLNKQGFMLTLSRGINQLIQVASDNIEDIDRVMEALAQGDLTRKINSEYQGAFGKLSQNINKTVDSLREAVGQILEASDVINASSDEIAAGNADMSERTEQQAMALEQTASTMEGLTKTVRHNAENAVEANRLSMSAYDTAEKGGQVVSKAIEAMAEINNSSGKIADIISVIDEIAFQTNLLALNASVEAARAGEQGRGFAVVATEVRNLAQRSATAAKEIKDLIVDSVEKVKVGSQLVNESGETLKEILQGINKVSEIVDQIAIASKEQYAGIEQANRAINQMDEVTQQHAALAEETSASSETLNHQAQALVTLVSRFKLGDGVRRADRESATSIGASYRFNSALENESADSKEEGRSQLENEEGNWENFSDD